MPDHVVWNLVYPTESFERMSTFRHHFEVLRTDPHVREVSATEDPHAMHCRMRVEFGAGYDRPQSQELRYADQIYIVGHSHISREINMGAPRPVVTGVVPQGIPAQEQAGVSIATWLPTGVSGLVPSIMSPSWPLHGGGEASGGGWSAEDPADAP